MKRRGRPPLPPDKRKPRLSGAQRRKQDRAKKLDTLRALAAELGIVVLDPLAPPPDVDDNDGFARLGAPPLDDPDTSLRWVRRVQLVALHAAITDPTIAMQQKLRLMKDLSFVVGATQNRNVLEERLVALEEELGLLKTKQPAVVTSSTKGVPRPSTARGGDRSRRLRPVDPPPPAVRDTDDGDPSPERH